MTDTPLHLDIEAEVRALFEAKLREFAAFCAQNWTMTTAEAETLTTPVASPEHWATGYTAAMTSGVTDALEFWLAEELGWT